DAGARYAAPTDPQCSDGERRRGQHAEEEQGSVCVKAVSGEKNAGDHGDRCGARPGQGGAFGLEPALWTAHDSTARTQRAAPARPIAVETTSSSGVYGSSRPSRMAYWTRDHRR